MVVFLYTKKHPIFECLMSASSRGRSQNQIVLIKLICHKKARNLLRAYIPRL